MKTTANKKEVKETKEMDQIELWKQEHGRIFKSIVSGKDYIWRRVKRKEYSAVMSMKDGEDIDERIYNRQYAIAKLVVLNLTEEELDANLEELAGLATTISDEVLEKSGFNLAGTIEL